MITQDKYKNGQKKQNYSNNYLTYYFKNGRTKAEGLYLNEKMEGTWKFYRETGELWQVGNFKNNQKNGDWTRYNRTGEIEYFKSFKNNIEVK